MESNEAHKNTLKRAGRMAQAWECLPSKSEVLSSNPSSIKKKECKVVQPLWKQYGSPSKKSDLPYHLAILLLDTHVYICVYVYVYMMKILPGKYITALFTRSWNGNDLMFIDRWIINMCVIQTYAYNGYIIQP
jgi:hypothetical protein